MWATLVFLLSNFFWICTGYQLRKTFHAKDEKADNNFMGNAIVAFICTVFSLFLFSKGL